MKPIMILFFGLGFLSNIQVTTAGNCPGFGTGEDSLKAIEYYSLYREFYKQKNFEDARVNWRYIFFNNPGARKSPYVDGVKIYEHFIKAETDADKKKSLVDTLMIIYDKRIECHGEEGKVLARKALAMVKHKHRTSQEMLATFGRSVELQKGKTKYYILYPYMLNTVIAYEKEKINLEEAMKIYQSIVDVIEMNLSNNSKDEEKFKSEQEKIDALLPRVIKNCEDAKGVYAKRYKEDPSNPKIWQGIFDLLKSARCTDEPIFVEVTIKLYDKEPKANLAVFLARQMKDQRKFQNAVRYYKQGINMEEETNTKADYCMELALLYQKLDDYPSARTYALKAAAAKANWGEPYLFIGDLYSGSGEKCGRGTGWESQVVTWPAIDMYNKARSIGPSCTEKANKKIAFYNKYMPTTEDIFFHGLKEGDQYKVNCWINADTIVRARKGE